MAQKNQLKVGIVLSYVNLAIGFIIPFVYTPIMLRMLGQSEYGLYSLANSVVAYLSLLSFGFGNTIVRYISKYRTEGNKEMLERTYGFFILLYCGMAILVAICGLILSGNVEAIFNKGLTTPEQAKMVSLVMVMTASASLSFPMSVFSSMVVSHERFIFRRVIDILSTIMGPVSSLIVLYLGYTSVGMAVSSLIMTAIYLPIYIIYCRKNLGLRPRFKSIGKPLIKEMVNVSFYHFLGSIVDMLFWATDKVILGILASSIAVAIYNVGATFNTMIVSLSTAITGVLAPKVTEMVVKDSSREKLTELFIKVGRVQFIIIGLVVSGFIAFGQEFISNWAGGSYNESYWIALLTIVPIVIPLIQNTGLTIIVAMNKHKFRSVVYFFIAIANVISTYILVPIMGSIGAALCSCISYLIGQGIIMNIYYHKKIGLDIPLFWKNILKMSIVPAGLCVVTFLLKRVVSFGGWPMFFTGVIAYTLIYVVLMYLFSMNDYEKQLFTDPIKTMIKKIKKD